MVFPVLFLLLFHIVWWSNRGSQNVCLELNISLCTVVHIYVETKELALRPSLAVEGVTLLILPLSVGQYKCNVMFCIFFGGVIFCFISQLMQCIILWKYRTILPCTFPGRLRSSVTVPPSAWRDKSSACPSRWVSAFRNCEIFWPELEESPGRPSQHSAKEARGGGLGRLGKASSHSFIFCQ
jgi:hypothetical protein